MQRLQPLRLYLIRHPETVDNVTGRFAGLRDSVLTPTGKAQAQATARRMRQTGISTILTSPAGRALSLAEALQTEANSDTGQGALSGAEKRVALHIVSELRERSFGQWDGLTFTEVQNLSPHAMQAWIDNPIGAAPPGGESLLQCIQRLQPFTEWLMQAATHAPTQSPRSSDFVANSSRTPPGAIPSATHITNNLPMPEGAVAIVTHGATLRVLLVLLLRLPFDALLKFGCDHAGVSIVELYGNDQAVLCTLNDTSHLRNGYSTYD